MGKISVSLPALFVLAAFFVLDQTALPFLFAASAAAHEGGHLLAMRICGRRLVRLRMTLTGAEIVYTQGSYRDDFAIALAGPAASLLLALGAAAAGRASGVPSLYTLSGVSLVLGTFNLLPAPPLDGGRALFAGLCVRSGPESAVRILRAAGAGTAGIVGILGIYGFRCTGSIVPLICAGLFLIFFVVNDLKMV